MSTKTENRALAPPPIVWRNWPLRDEPRPTRITAVIFAVVAACVVGATGSGWLALLAVVALAIALWRHFVPIEYHLGSRGLRQTVFGRVRLIRWRQIRVVEVRRRGVLLYPDSYFGPLRSMRGLYIPWSVHRDTVLAVVEYYAATVIVNHVEPPPTGDSPTEAPPELDDTDDYPSAPVNPRHEGSTETHLDVRAS